MRFVLLCSRVLGTHLATSCLELSVKPAELENVTVDEGKQVLELSYVTQTVFY